MRNIIRIILLVLLTGALSTLVAETNQSTAQKITDPTLAFFVALHACKPGDYEEKNIMTKIVGPAMLKHEIIGRDLYDICEVILQTPDGRYMDCTFKQDDLDKVADQHFMTGVLTATTDSPSSTAQNSEMIWTNIKLDNCRFKDD